MLLLHASKVALNDAGLIEMEESVGETLSEKLEDFDELLPNIGESQHDLDQEEVTDGQEAVEEEMVKERVEDQDLSPVSNGHSIVTEATIEAHDMTDLDQSVIVSSVSCSEFSLFFLVLLKRKCSLD